MRVNNYYVYFLIDSRNGLPFYVGKGKGARMSYHVLEASKPTETWSNAIKCRRILAILRNGGEVVERQVHVNLSNSDALRIEANYIREYGRIINNSGILTNVIDEDRVHPVAYKPVDQYTLAGELVCTYSSVQEAAMAANVTPNTISGVINNRRYKGKQMRTAGGFRWAHAGQQLPVYNRWNTVYQPKQRPVCQYTLTGQLVKTYDSTASACRELGLDPGRVSTCCNRGRIKTVSGFCWAFEGSVPVLPNLSNKRYAGHLHQSGLGPDPV